MRLLAAGLLLAAHAEANDPQQNVSTVFCFADSDCAASRNLPAECADSVCRCARPASASGLYVYDFDTVSSEGLGKEYGRFATGRSFPDGCYAPDEVEGIAPFLAYMKFPGAPTCPIPSWLGEDWSGTGTPPASHFVTAKRSIVKAIEDASGLRLRDVQQHCVGNVLHLVAGFVTRPSQLPRAEVVYALLKDRLNRTDLGDDVGQHLGTEAFHLHFRAERVAEPCTDAPSSSIAPTPKFSVKDNKYTCRELGIEVQWKENDGPDKIGHDELYLAGKYKGPNSVKDDFALWIKDFFGANQTLEKDEYKTLYAAFFDCYGKVTGETCTFLCPKKALNPVGRMPVYCDSDGFLDLREAAKYWRPDNSSNETGWYGCVENATAPPQQCLYNGAVVPYLDLVNGYNDCFHKTHGETCAVACAEGYRASGPLKLSCVQDNVFPVDSVACLPNVCKKPILPEPMPDIHFDRFSDCSGRRSGDYCTLECAPGTVGRRMRLVCDEDGDYAVDYASICNGTELSICTTPVRLPMSDMNISDCIGKPSFSSCTWTCPHGYRMDSSEFTLTCGRSGEFDASAALCKPNSCQKPYLCEEKSGPGGRKTGDLCTRRDCGPGYSARTAVLRCGSSSSSDTPLPDCEANACTRRPASSADGTAEDLDCWATGKRSGDNCTYTGCQSPEYYSPDPKPHQLICDESGLPVNLFCEPNTCTGGVVDRYTARKEADLNLITNNGTYTLDELFYDARNKKTGESFRFPLEKGCGGTPGADSGYAIWQGPGHGPNLNFEYFGLKCNATGALIVDQPLECKGRQCSGSPQDFHKKNPPTNAVGFDNYGTCQQNAGRRTGESCEVKCKSGFRPIGKTTLHCVPKKGSNGMDGSETLPPTEPFSCEPNTCEATSVAEIAAIKNWTLVGDGPCNATGDNCTVACKTGHMFDNSTGLHSNGTTNYTVPLTCKLHNADVDNTVFDVTDVPSCVPNICSESINQTFASCIGKRTGDSCEVYTPTGMWLYWPPDENGRTYSEKNTMSHMTGKTVLDNLVCDENGQQIDVGYSFEGVMCHPFTTILTDLSMNKRATRDRNSNYYGTFWNDKVPDDTVFDYLEHLNPIALYYDALNPCPKPQHGVPCTAPCGQDWAFSSFTERTFAPTTMTPLCASTHLLTEIQTSTSNPVIEFDLSGGSICNAPYTCQSPPKAPNLPPAECLDEQGRILKSNSDLTTIATGTIDPYRGRQPYEDPACFTGSDVFPRVYTMDNSNNTAFDDCIGKKTGEECNLNGRPGLIRWQASCFANGTVWPTPLQSLQGPMYTYSDREFSRTHFRDVPECLTNSTIEHVKEWIDIGGDATPFRKKKQDTVPSKVFRCDEHYVASPWPEIRLGREPDGLVVDHYQGMVIHYDSYPDHEWVQKSVRPLRYWNGAKTGLDEYKWRRVNTHGTRYDVQGWDSRMRWPLHPTMGFPESASDTYYTDRVDRALNHSVTVVGKYCRLDVLTPFRTPEAGHTVSVVVDGVEKLFEIGVDSNAADLSAYNSKSKPYNHGGTDLNTIYLYNLHNFTVHLRRVKDTLLSDVAADEEFMYSSSNRTVMAHEIYSNEDASRSRTDVFDGFHYHWVCDMPSYLPPYRDLFWGAASSRSHIMPQRPKETDMSKTERAAWDKQKETATGQAWLTKVIEDRFNLESMYRDFYKLADSHLLHSWMPCLADSDGHMPDTNRLGTCLPRACLTELNQEDFNVFKSRFTESDFNAKPMNMSETYFLSDCDWRFNSVTPEILNTSILYDGYFTPKPLRPLYHGDTCTLRCDAGFVVRPLTLTCPPPSAGGSPFSEGCVPYNCSNGTYGTYGAVRVDGSGGNMILAEAMATKLEDFFSSTSPLDGGSDAAYGVYGLSLAAIERSRGGGSFPTLDEVVELIAFITAGQSHLTLGDRFKNASDPLAGCLDRHSGAVCSDVCAEGYTLNNDAIFYAGHDGYKTNLRCNATGAFEVTIDYLYNLCVPNPCASMVNADGYTQNMPNGTLYMSVDEWRSSDDYAKGGRHNVSSFSSSYDDPAPLFWGLFGNETLSGDDSERVKHIKANETYLWTGSSLTKLRYGSVWEEDICSDPGNMTLVNTYGDSMMCLPNGLFDLDQLFNTLRCGYQCTSYSTFSEKFPTPKPSNCGEAGTLSVGGSYRMWPHQDCECTCKPGWLGASCDIDCSQTQCNAGEAVALNATAGMCACTQCSDTVTCGRFGRLFADTSAANPVCSCVCDPAWIVAKDGVPCDATRPLLNISTVPDYRSDEEKSLAEKENGEVKRPAWLSQVPLYVTDPNKTSDAWKYGGGGYLAPCWDYSSFRHLRQPDSGWKWDYANLSFPCDGMVNYTGGEALASQDDCCWCRQVYPLCEDVLCFTPKPGTLYQFGWGGENNEPKNEEQISCRRCAPTHYGLPGNATGSCTACPSLSDTIPRRPDFGGLRATGQEVLIYEPDPVQHVIGSDGELRRVVPDLSDPRLVSLGALTEDKCYGSCSDLTANMSAEEMIPYTNCEQCAEGYQGVPIKSGNEGKLSGCVEKAWSCEVSSHVPANAHPFNADESAQAVTSFYTSNSGGALPACHNTKHSCTALYWLLETPGFLLCLARTAL